jgi:hypothetical protein
VKVLVRRSLYVRSLTGVLQFGAVKRDSLSPTSPLPLGSPGGCSSKKTFLKKEKFFKKTGETPSVTQGSRAFADLDPWDQPWNHPWNPI